MLKILRVQYLKFEDKHLRTSKSSNHRNSNKQTTNSSSENECVAEQEPSHDRATDNYENSRDIFAGRTYDVIERPLPELRFNGIESDVVSLEKEHIYESIDNVFTRNTSCQTENHIACNETFALTDDDFRLFTETSCQTEPECRHNVKRNGEAAERMFSGIGKTKECRLSSDSSTSTQDSHDSGDSGRYSGQNAERSPRSPTDESTYIWQPEGLNNVEVKSFMASLPHDNFLNVMTPDGVAQFNSQLAYQNPKQDGDPSLCRSLTKEQEISLKCLNMTILEARGTGFIKISDNNSNSCEGCGNSFAKNDMVVSAGQGLRHPSCFTCTVCHQFLTKLIYYTDSKKQLYCGRHYAELFKSRCHDCDELIIAGKFVRAMGNTYHAEHFRCGKCDAVIGEGKYSVEDDRVVCYDCHVAYYADECASCREKVTVAHKRMSVGERHWHDACFACNKCGVHLVHGSFKLCDGGRILCGKCDQPKNKMCCNCGEEIKPGTRWLQHAEGLFYHAGCFRCHNCRREIVANFMEKNGSFYCPGCHRHLFSEKCTGCSLPVLDDGVTYNNEIWHNACFRCDNCERTLSSRKFLLRDGHRYCDACYEESFAKQCHNCGKKIKDGAYLTTNDLFWHSHCFKCAQCEKDLGNVGFHMIDDRTYCSDCPSY